MERGWISLYRKSVDSQVFRNEGLWKTWSWCLIKAAHKKYYAVWDIGTGTTEVELRRGQFIFGRKAAARELNMKESTVRYRMNKLKSIGNIDIHSTTHYSVVTICNWSKYQKADSEDSQPLEQPNSQPDDSQQPASSQPDDTYNNLENVKNVEECKDTLAQTQKNSFKQFWNTYPRKKSKGQAERAWKKIKPDDNLLNQILTGIEKAKLSHEWIKDNGVYIPYPATWLNAKGWEDEHKPYRPTTTGAKPTPEPSKDLSDWGELLHVPTTTQTIPINSRSEKSNKGNGEIEIPPYLIPRAKIIDIPDKSRVVRLMDEIIIGFDWNETEEDRTTWTKLFSEYGLNAAADARLAIIKKREKGNSLTPDEEKKYFTRCLTHVPKSQLNPGDREREEVVS